MKQYTYFRFGRWYFSKTEYEFDEETLDEKVFAIKGIEICTVKVQVYENITMGQAKRILRNHYMNWNPRRCGEGLRKLKDKKYISGGCNCIYNSRTKKLTICIPYNKVKILSKELLED